MVLFFISGSMERFSCESFFSAFITLFCRLSRDFAGTNTPKQILADKLSVKHNGSYSPTASNSPFNAKKHSAAKNVFFLPMSLPANTSSTRAEVASTAGEIISIAFRYLEAESKKPTNKNNTKSMKGTYFKRTNHLFSLLTIKRETRDSTSAVSAEWAKNVATGLPCMRIEADNNTTGIMNPYETYFHSISASFILKSNIIIENEMHIITREIICSAKSNCTFLPPLLKRH